MGMSAAPSVKPASQTFGEIAVGLSFNPSNSPKVDECKKKFAAIIDQLEELRFGHPNQEIRRLASVAITEAQTAQMWAVKAITFNN